MKRIHTMECGDSLDDLSVAIRVVHALSWKFFAADSESAVPGSVIQRQTGIPAKVITIVAPDINLAGFHVVEIRRGQEAETRFYLAGPTGMKRRADHLRDLARGLTFKAAEYDRQSKRDNKAAADRKRQRSEIERGARPEQQPEHEAGSATSTAAPQLKQPRRPNGASHARRAKGAEARS